MNETARLQNEVITRGLNDLESDGASQELPVIITLQPHGDRIRRDTYVYTCRHPIVQVSALCFPVNNEQ